MRNKTITAFLIMSLSASMAWAAEQAASPDPVVHAEKRMASFKKRIDQGKVKKSLTADETSKLESEYAAIAKMISDAKADGKVTQAEMESIQERQDAFSKSIRMEKHDTEGVQQPTKRALKP